MISANKQRAKQPMAGRNVQEFFHHKSAPIKTSWACYSFKFLLCSQLKLGVLEPVQVSKLTLIQSQHEHGSYYCRATSSYIEYRILIQEIF